MNPNDQHESPMIKGPLKLTELWMCLQCPTLIEPGEEVYLIEDEDPEGKQTYVHTACLQAYLTEEEDDAPTG